MKNYAEELAYWYFRLNGFIPMSNFVLHRQKDIEQQQNVHTSDCDLLAIRFPFPWEQIGGQELDYDHELLQVLGCDNQRTVVAIIQVKSGGYQDREIADYFSTHLEYLVRRVGLLPPEEVRKFVRELDRVPVLSTPTCVFSKVTLLRPKPRPAKDPPWTVLNFDVAVEFIKERFRRYAEKRRDRMFFADSIIQFLADQSHIERQMQLFGEHG